MSLVNKFDSEFPDRYFEEIMDYLVIYSGYFRNDLTDKFKAPYLWRKTNQGWVLRHNLNMKEHND